MQLQDLIKLENQDVYVDKKHRRRHIKVKCSICGVDCYVEAYRDNRMHLCNRVCRGSHRRIRDFGYTDRVVNDRGYAFLKSPEHPDANSRGYVREHRYVMAWHLGRALDKTEVVHHVDGNRLNNHISNLFLLKSDKEHGDLHNDLLEMSHKLIRAGVIVLDRRTGKHRFNTSVLCNPDTIDRLNNV